MTKGGQLRTATRIGDSADCAQSGKRSQNEKDSKKGAINETLSLKSKYNISFSSKQSLKQNINQTNIVRLCLIR
jgi:hypothetical protein